MGSMKLEAFTIHLNQDRGSYLLLPIVQVSVPVPIQEQLYCFQWELYG